MFKVFIAGKTIQELRDNVHEFYVGIGGNEVYTQQDIDLTSITSRIIKEEADKLKNSPNPFGGDFAKDTAKILISEGLPMRQASVAPTNPNAPKDSRGIAFDARIHSKEGEFNKNGSWRYRRNAPKDLIRQLENAPVTASPMVQTAPQQQVAQNPQPVPVISLPSFLQLPTTAAPAEMAFPTQSPPSIPFSAPANPAPAPMTFQQATQPPPQAAPVVATPFVPQVVQPAPTPVTPMYEQIAVPATASQPAHDLASFKNNFAVTMNQLITSKKIDQPWIAEVNRAFGVQNIWDVTKNEAQLGQLFDCLCQNGLITKVG